MNLQGKGVYSEVLVLSSSPLSAPTSGNQLGGGAGLNLGQATQGNCTLLQHPVGSTELDRVHVMGHCFIKCTCHRSRWAPIRDNPSAAAARWIECFPEWWTTVG